MSPFGVVLKFPSAQAPNKFYIGRCIIMRIRFFYHLSEESNPGWLGEKRKLNLCVMPPPLIQGSCNEMR